MADPLGVDGAGVDAPVRVIVLNGSSSSGKTTVATRLQDLLPGLWLLLGTDTLTSAFPARITDPDSAIREDDARAVAAAFGVMEESLRHMVAHLTQHGIGVIVDAVMHRGDPDAALWRQALSGQGALWVKVFAPIEVVVERESHRADRVNGTASLQASVHQGVAYDIEIDTSTPPQGDPDERGLRAIVNLVTAPGGAAPRARGSGTEPAHSFTGDEGTPKES